MVDIETRNGCYMWNNQRGGQNHVASWLDRFILPKTMVNEEKEETTQVLPSARSDHWPVSLVLEDEGTPI